MATRLLGGSAAICALFAAASPLEGQANVDFALGSNVLVGYVANAPQQMLGVGALAMLPAPRRWGLYADVKIAVDSPARETFLRSMTPAQAEAAGDEWARTSRAWTTANVAAVRSVGREMALYLGAGVSWESVYSQYLDETRTRAEGGRYWVEEADQARTRPNVLGGGFFRMGRRLVFQFGAEAAPAGVSVGAHWLAR